MELLERLLQEFALGPIGQISELPGSGKCYLVSSGDQRFVYKQVGRRDFVSIYDKVQQVLNNQGLLQAKVLTSRTGQLITADGFSLFEYVPGDALLQFDDEQFEAVVHYLRGYNQALRTVPFDPAELAEVNTWDRVKPVDSLCSLVESADVRSRLDQGASALLQRAASILHEHADELHDDSRKQLIHSDLGPGNTLFMDGRVHAIIDFTPEYEHELYSLAHFLYWTCLWQPDAGSLRRLTSALPIYYGTDAQGIERGQAVLFVYLVKACLFRVLGPMLDMLERGTFAPEKMTRRTRALQGLLDLQQSMSV